MVDLGEIQAAYYMVAATGVLVAAAYYIVTLRVNQKSAKTTFETRQVQALLRARASNDFSGSMPVFIR